MSIIAHLRSKMPWLIGKEDAQKELIKNLSVHFREVEVTKQIPAGDFPNLGFMQQRLTVYPDFTLFSQESERLKKEVEQVLTVDLPSLMKVIQPPKSKDLNQTTNPFAQIPWDITTEDKAVYDQLFNNLEKKNGRISGQVGQKILMDTGLDRGLLFKIWELSDIEKTGFLDAEEFAVAMHLTEQVKRGYTLPQSIPYSLVPPAKRHLIKT